MDKIFSVYELNLMVKKYLENNDFLNNIYIKGEMSNVTYYKSGHLYFTLKDDKASVKCAAFKYLYKGISKDLKAGDQVKVLGKVTLYEVNGQYQLIVDSIEKENKLGKLYEELEKLKVKLKEKGYFDPENKKPLPFLPLNIGVVTSPTGAAVRDIIRTAKKRYNNVNIYLAPAKVQGEGSVDEIIEGIKLLERTDFIDVIIAGRGGGSIEDLWSFNDERVAEVIYNCKKPIVSAVGHEIDIMISDFVADLRAATPTHSAELVVPEKEALKQLLRDKVELLNYKIRRKIENKHLLLNQRKESYIIRNFAGFISDKRNVIIDREEQLNKNFRNYISILKQKIEHKKEKLESLNPEKVLQRGYSITMKDGKIVKDSGKLNIGDKISTRLANGEVESRVE